MKAVTEYSSRELFRMKKPDQQALCRKEEIEFQKSDQRGTLYKLLNDERKRRMEQSQPESEPDQPPPKPDDDFKEALNINNSPVEMSDKSGEDDSSVPAVGPSGRGGPDRGQGRHKGLTDWKARVQRASRNTVPNITIRQGTYLVFASWSNKVKIPPIKIDSDAEADLIALPLSHLAQIFFPGMIPEIAGICVSLIYGCYAVTAPRLALIKEVQAAREEGRDVEEILKGFKK